jgi:beta-glucosidase
MARVSFPDGFLWGTATAAHQVEGGNWNNDWWEWEHNPSSGCTEPSGDACDHWHRFPADIALLADLGFTSYRFSIEWSRIEPEEGEWSRVALDHYRRMCATCLEYGLAPVVTYHHFTTPRWLARRGGWEEPATADAFARLCERTVGALGDLQAWACTINEPNVVATIGYLAKAFPPGKQDVALRRKVNDILIDAHRKGGDAIRSGRGSAPVGLTLSMQDYQAVDGGEAKRDRIRHSMEDVYLEAARTDDYIGVQTYTRERVGPGGALGPEGERELTQMGYEFWPEALEATIRRAWEVTEGVPIIVTENGIGCGDDHRRIAYVRHALAGVRQCLDDGIEVGGYFYWSAMDNFEWAHGYMPTFGLIAVDRATQERTVKPSGRWLGRVARDNAFDVA